MPNQTTSSNRHRIISNHILYYFADTDCTYNFCTNYCITKKSVTTAQCKNLEHSDKIQTPTKQRYNSTII